MKVLLCLCLLIAAGSTFEWLKKRRDFQGNGGPDCTDRNQCFNLYRPIDRVLKNPNFDLLVSDDGHLYLNCSTNVLSQAQTIGCRTAAEECLWSMSSFHVLAAWQYFCDNKPEVEKLHDCWNVIDPAPAVRRCIEQNQGNELVDFMPRCVGDAVKLVPQCGEEGGDLAAGLLHNIYM